MLKPVIGCLGVLCAGCSTLPAPTQPAARPDEPAGLPLIISEPLGVARTNEPVLGGIPVPQGRIRGPGAFILAGENGREFVVEGTPAAYWPDGSVKWLHLCGRVDVAGGPNRFTLRPAPPCDYRGLDVTATNGTIRVRDGGRDVLIRGDDAAVLSVVSVAGVPQALLKAPGLSGRLTYVSPDGERRTAALTYAGETPETVVRTDARVVVRLPGRFEDADGTPMAELITFFEVIRGVSEVRIEPVWIYLGSPSRDLVQELSLTVHVPVESNNCVTAFSNERGEGFWDVVQRFRDQGAGAGPRWPMARQVQIGSSFYRTEKLTFPQDASWLKATAGQRAQGWCYLGDTQLGVVAAMRYFWQEYPHSLALDTDAGTLTFGLIPAEAPPLDLRRYSPIVYGGDMYEAGQGRFRTDLHGPTGLAKAFELMLRFNDAATSPQDLGEDTWHDLRAQRAELVKSWKTLSRWVTDPAHQGRDLPETERQAMIAQAKACREALRNLSTTERRWVESRRGRRIEQVVKPGLFFTRPCRLMVPPQAFAESRVLGQVSAGDAGGWPAIEKRIRDVMDDAIRERDYQNWYGLLDFGDMQMAYYSEGGLERWGFDHGGYAWLNTEAIPDYGLWMSALRHANAGWLEAALEMSRHNRDLDTYHRTAHAGLGSRHGVNHWSDPDKEWRVSMPLVRRLHYYTTADPWTKEAILGTVAVYQSYTNRTSAVAPSMVSAFSGLLVKWELTGDAADGTVVRNMAAGLAASVREDGQFTGRLHANLATGESRPDGDQPLGGTFFLYGFGGQHAIVEAAGLLRDPRLDEAIVRNARLGGAGQVPFQAYAYRLTGDAQIRDRMVTTLKSAFVLTAGRTGGAGMFDEPEHPAFGGPVPNKNMCSYLGDMMYALPYGMAAVPAEPPAAPQP